MNKSLLVGSLVLALAFTGAASASDKKFIGYVIKAKTQVVDGTMLINGYGPDELMAFIRQDCASGRLGSLAYVGKPYKRRGHTFQKFRTSCAGGPSPRIGKTSAVTVEVERMPDGRNMTEYTYGVRGNIQYRRVIR